MDPDREVPDPLIAVLLDAACQAPTHGLIEPWRFLVMTGPARERLAAQLPAVYDAVTPRDQVRPDKREKLGLVFLQAPVVIVLACHHPPGCKIPLLENQLAVACAVQNLHLAAHAAGLAAMWSSQAHPGQRVGSSARRCSGEAVSAPSEAGRVGGR